MKSMRKNSSSSHALIHSELKQSTPAIKTPFSIDDFYQNAVSGHALLITSCNSEPSWGCYHFGDTFYDEFQKKLDHIKVRVVIDSDQHFTATFQNSLPKINYKYIYLTGCRVRAAEWIIDHLPNFNRDVLETVYLVKPPHLQTSFASAEISALREKFITAAYNVHIVTTGFILPSLASIGSPSSISSKSISKFQLPESCYGLIYINAADLMTADGERFIKAYFSQVSIAARSNRESITTVAVIGMDGSDENYIYINKIATKTNAAIKCIPSPNLEQSNFIECIRQISRKNGIIATDDAHTVRQILNLKAKFLIFNPPNMKCNKAFYVSMVNMLPKKLQKLGKVILGQSNNYSLLREKKELLQKIVIKLHVAEMDSVRKFNSDKQDNLKTETVSENNDSTFFANALSVISCGLYKKGWRHILDSSLVAYNSVVSRYARSPSRHS